MRAVRVERVDADHLRLTLSSETLLTNEDWERLRQAKPQKVWREYDNSHFTGLYVCFREQPYRESFIFKEDEWEELCRIFREPAL